MKLKKNQMFKILVEANSQEVENISNVIYENHSIKVVKPPHKTLVMSKVREPINNSLFYLGEVLACECMVEVNNFKGVAVIKGDDFEKVTSIAIIDAALNADVKESEKIIEEIIKLREKQKENRDILNAQIMKSKVTFSVMSEE